MRLGIHWFRRDLRIRDNPALRAAAARCAEVIPVYVLSDWRRAHRWTGPGRQQFLCGCLAELARSLEQRGGRLVVRRGDADAELAKLILETGASAIFFQRDPDPFGRAMEQRLADAARSLDCEMIGFDAVTLHQPDEVLTATGGTFRIFSPFARAWNQLPKPAPDESPFRLQTPASVKSQPLPTLADWDLAPSSMQFVAPGETAAQHRLTQFLDDRATSYQETRNLPAASGTSRLSQDLRWGTLSIRDVYAQVMRRAAHASAAGRRSLVVYVNELAWREFNLQLLWHFPEVLNEEWNPKFRGFPWREPRAEFDRWCAGETGFPIVDAGLRELNATGFMHNRVRMIVAMFLTKDLHVDWRAGERYFARHLIESEIASNNGGWQWSAGTGADAAPYFRIQNPWLQTARHDPDGEYIKRWLPELRDVPPAEFHHPPLLGASLARGYPAPIVDHARERDVTLDQFKQFL